MGTYQDEQNDMMVGNLVQTEDGYLATVVDARNGKLSLTIPGTEERRTVSSLDVANPPSLAVLKRLLATEGVKGLASRQPQLHKASLGPKTEQKPVNAPKPGATALNPAETIPSTGGLMFGFEGKGDPPRALSANAAVNSPSQGGVTFGFSGGNKPQQATPPKFGFGPSSSASAGKCPAFAGRESSSTPMYTAGGKDTMMSDNTHTPARAQSPLASVSVIRPRPMHNLDSLAVARYVSRMGANNMAKKRQLARKHAMTITKTYTVGQEATPLDGCEPSAFRVAVAKPATAPPAGIPLAPPAAAACQHEVDDNIAYRGSQGNSSSECSEISLDEPDLDEPAPSSLTAMRALLANRSNPQEGDWRCAHCKVMLTKAALKCVSCDTPKPGATAEKPASGAASFAGIQFGFGVATAAAPVPTVATPAAAAAPAGGIHFGNEGSSKVESTQMPKSATPGSGKNISADVDDDNVNYAGSGDDGSSSDCSEISLDEPEDSGPDPKVLAMKAMLADQNNPKDGDWRCANCKCLLVKEALKCVGCDTPKPGAPAEKPAAAAGGIQFGFGVGSSAPAVAPSVAFGFGSSAPAVAPAVAFGFGSSAPAVAPALAFGFGSSAPAVAPAVAFGFGSSAPAVAPAVAFGFGSSAPAAAPAVAFGFGSSTPAEQNPAFAAARSGTSAGQKDASKPTTSARPTDDDVNDDNVNYAGSGDDGSSSDCSEISLDEPEDSGPDPKVLAMKAMLADQNNPKDGDWRCANCKCLLVKEALKCVGCDTPKPGAPAEKPAAAAGGIQFGFGVGSSAPAVAPALAFGFGSSAPAVAPAVAFGFGSSAPAVAPALAFGFGSSAPAVAPAVAFGFGSSAPAVAPAVAFGFGSSAPAAAPAVAFGFGSSTPAEQNPAFAAARSGTSAGQKDASKPTTSARPTDDDVNDDNVNYAGSGDDGSSSDCSEISLDEPEDSGPDPKVLAMKAMLADQNNPKDGDWRCANCKCLLVKEALKCVGCDTPKPGAPAEKPAAAAGGIQFGFGVGSTSSSATAAPTTFGFGSTGTPSRQNSSPFSFGASSSAAPSSFTFGATPDTAAAASSFSFGVSYAAAQPAPSFSFGTSAPAFSFGAAAPQSFSFGSPAPK